MELNECDYCDVDKIGQSGIISCLALNPSMTTMYAAGSFNRSGFILTHSVCFCIVLPLLSDISATKVYHLQLKYCFVCIDYS